MRKRVDANRREKIKCKNKEKIMLRENKLLGDRLDRLNKTKNKGGRDIKSVRKGQRMIEK